VFKDPWLLLFIKAAKNSDEDALPIDKHRSGGGSMFPKALMHKAAAANIVVTVRVEPDRISMVGVVVTASMDRLLLLLLLV
jgi:hypothetical protein